MPATKPPSRRGKTPSEPSRAPAARAPASRALDAKGSARIKKAVKAIKGSPDERTRSSSGRACTDLALQGGGSHGAFTWGVLDRLLDEDGIDVSGVSGTSAGALNGAVMLTGYVQGYEQGGVEQARRQAQQALRDFWQDVSSHGPLFSPLTVQPNGLLKPQFNVDQLPGFEWVNLFMRSFSPYEFNPLNINPLQDALRRHVSIEALQQAGARCDVPLFVTATAVRTGQARVFTGEQITLDALMASACLPFLFQAVEIDGESYWDGGYTGNPALFPLIYNTRTLDLLLVKINPMVRDDKPTRSIDIMDRLSEITFNASLVGEMRAIAFVSRLLKEQKLDAGRYKNLRLHMVADDAALAPYNASSKFNTDWNFLKELHRLGHAAADRWLAAHRADVGARSTLDIEQSFLGTL